MVEPEKLIASADEIDNRLGPIPGRSSDRIARELRDVARELIRLRIALRAVMDAKSDAYGIAKEALSVSRPHLSTSEK